MLSLLEMPNHKITYFIVQPDYVKGLWDTLANYRIEHTKENHKLLIDLVQEKLGGSDIEREWSEREYETFVKFERNEVNK